MDINTEIETQDLKYEIAELKKQKEELEVERDILKEQLSVTHSFLQLKDKETMTFWEWAAHNKLETKNDEVLYNEIWYYLPDLVRKYEREIKDNL